MVEGLYKNLILHLKLNFACHICASEQGDECVGPSTLGLWHIYLKIYVYIYIYIYMYMYILMFNCDLISVLLGFAWGWNFILEESTQIDSQNEMNQNN